MSAKIIDGKAVAARVRAEVAQEVEQFAPSTGARPASRRSSSATIPPRAVYVDGKQKACAEVGHAGFDHRLPADASHDEVLALIERLNGDDASAASCCQLPVPAHSTASS